MFVGNELLCVSYDGTLCYASFSTGELGTPMPEDNQKKYCEMQTSSTAQNTVSVCSIIHFLCNHILFGGIHTQLAESSEVFELQKHAEEEEDANGVAASSSSSNDSSSNMATYAKQHHQEQPLKVDTCCMFLVNSHTFVSFAAGAAATRHQQRCTCQWACNY